MTLQELVIMILREIGVYTAGQGDQLDSEIANDVVLRLKIMVESWDAEGHITFYRTKEAFTLSPLGAGITIVTMGPGGDFNTVRPVKIVGGYVRDINGTDYTLDTTVSPDQYNALSIKTEPGRPYWLYWNPTYPLMNLYFFYLPDQTYTVTLDSVKSIVNWSILTDTLNLPPEYLDALHWCGSESMLSSYPMDRPQEQVQLILKQAARALGTVKRLNASVQNKPVKMFAVPGQRMQGFWKQGDIQSGNPYPF